MHEIEMLSPVQNNIQFLLFIYQIKYTQHIISYKKNDRKTIKVYYIFFQVVIKVKINEGVG
jgi:hypothetical protein